MAKKSQNMFEKAKANAVPAEQKKGKGKVPTVEIPELHLLTSLGIVLQTVRTLYATVEGKVKATVKEKFIEMGTSEKHQPKNFEGVDGEARASCQLKKRSSTSTLSEEEKAILEKFKLSFKKDVKQQGAYIVNPVHAGNQEYLEKAAKHLGKAGLPEDFIIWQPEVYSIVTTDESIEEVFARVSDPKDIHMLLDVVASLALKPNLDGDPTEAIREVTKILLEKK
jgi:hypothetical protein